MSLEFNCSIPKLQTIQILQQSGILSQMESMPADFVCKSEGSQTIIEIPSNTNLKLPLQMVNVLSQKQAAKSTTKIFVGERSKVQFIHCDDSMNEQEANSENTIEVFIGNHSSLDYYKMENLNNASSLKTSVNFHLQEHAFLKVFGFSLNGKQISNTFNVNLNKPQAEAHLNGLYLMDRQQEVETIVNIFHKAESCRSNQLFKGILDDSARATFLGHVFVDYGSKGTEAMQTNKNILLTDKARVNTRPFLEIYNDDVKCSHGATIGQLDDKALFYLRSRGIGIRAAKTLLMYAFCQEVLAESMIEALKESLEELIKMRLQGELSTCSSCIFQCPQAHN